MRKSWQAEVDLMYFLSRPFLVGFLFFMAAGPAPSALASAKSQSVVSSGQKFLIENTTTVLEVLMMEAYSDVSQESLAAVGDRLKLDLGSIQMPKVLLLDNELSINGKRSGIRVESMSPLRVTFKSKTWSYNKAQLLEQNYTSLREFFGVKRSVGLLNLFIEEANAQPPGGFGGVGGESAAVTFPGVAAGSVMGMHAVNSCVDHPPCEGVAVAPIAARPISAAKSDDPGSIQQIFCEPPNTPPGTPKDLRWISGHTENGKIKLSEYQVVRYNKGGAVKVQVNEDWGAPRHWKDMDVALTVDPSFWEKLVECPGGSEKILKTSNDAIRKMKYAQFHLDHKGQPNFPVLDEGGHADQ